ncbi:MAG: hypothetical protein ACJA01_003670, partial [Saprospiraceae bacterium]
MKHHLKLCDNELQDVGQRFEMEIDTAAFNNFSDFFFNNIITDWILNQQVSSALGSAKSVQEYVNRLIQDLQSRRQEIVNTIERLRENRESI